MQNIKGTVLIFHKELDWVFNKIYNWGTLSTHSLEAFRDKASRGTSNCDNPSTSASWGLEHFILDREKEFLNYLRCRSILHRLKKKANISLLRDSHEECYNIPSSVFETLTIPVIVTVSPGTQLSTRSWASSHSIVRGIRPASLCASDISSCILRHSTVSS